MLSRVLIANRGEIALRLIRACSELGIETVCAHSEADSNAMPTRLADHSICIGGAKAQDSYLNISAILSAAEITDVDAIHPGIGFLAESSDFASLVGKHNIKFIGASPEHIEIMGNKLRGRELAQKLGWNVLPASEEPLTDVNTGRKAASELGYPLVTKAIAGGGGRGMRVIEHDEHFEELFMEAQAESLKSFGDKRMLLEKYLPAPRHIEIQVLCDGKGQGIHVYERDCSIQRRKQKLIEETPGINIERKKVEELALASLAGLNSLGYEGLGTVEYLYKDGEFYFIEMNTRLQVEHTISEMVSGIDLVKEQLRIAGGSAISKLQSEVQVQGHAMEFRINAEDSKTFIPSSGKIEIFHPPGGLGVRIDTYVYSGYTLPPFYDNLIAKLIVHGIDRNEVIKKSKLALREFVVTGLNTNLQTYRQILEHPDFIAGDTNIEWLEKNVSGQE